MREMWVGSLGWEDPLENGMATHSNILAWKIPWREEPDGLVSTGLKRVRHDWATIYIHIYVCMCVCVYIYVDVNICVCIQSLRRLERWSASSDTPSRVLANCWQLFFPKRGKITSRHSRSPAGDRCTVSSQKSLRTGVRSESSNRSPELPLEIKSTGVSLLALPSPVSHWAAPPSRDMWRSGDFTEWTTFRCLKATHAGNGSLWLLKTLSR